MSYLHVEARLGFSPDANEEFAAQYGEKALGLSRLPYLATPPFIALHRRLYDAWASTGSMTDAYAASGEGPSLSERVRELIGARVLVRSSSTKEGILDRGRFDTLAVNLDEGDLLDGAIEQVFKQFNDQDAPGGMGIVIQLATTSELSGHLSNEHRVADKPYRWRVEIASGKRTAKGDQSYMISAKQAADESFDEALILGSGSMLRRRLSSVARWVWRRAAEEQIDRSALEWGWDGQRLWIYQWDRILDALDIGIDPRQGFGGNSGTPACEDGQLFRRHLVGASTPWPKLRKLADFSVAGRLPPHRLFSAPADRIVAALTSTDGRGLITREVDALTGGQAVLRSDTVNGGFDLPKTDTVSGEEALKFLDAATSSMQQVTDDPRGVGFLLHQYIASRSSAWSYYNPESNFVYIDGLWGLADGMQYLDCDTFVYDRRLQREVSATLRYKAKVLIEQDGGSWRYQDVKGAIARQRSLSASAVRDIGTNTVDISKNLSEPVQIMWFSGIDPARNLGENLPWFRTEPQPDISEQAERSLVPFVVRKITDFQELSPEDAHRTKVILEPDVSDIRSAEYVLEVASWCMKLAVPVEMRGSILSHAYHQLRALGVVVYSASPTRRPSEVRQRKAFDKLVRDDIPGGITARGEAVNTYQLSNDDRKRAITSKLVEEAEEFLLAQGQVAITEELADLYQLIASLARDSGVSMDAVESAAALKRQKRGAFEKGVMLSETSTRVVEKDREDLFLGHVLDEVPETRSLAETNRSGGQGSFVTVPVDRLLGAHLPVFTDLVSGDARIRLKISLRQGRVGVEVVFVDRSTDVRLL